MAAETPVAENYSDDLLDDLAGEVVGGTTRDQMLGTFSRISSILVKAHNGAVRMHAEIEDPERSCSGPLCYTHRRSDRLSPY